jgi:hypothetical protein
MDVADGSSYFPLFFTSLCRLTLPLLTQLSTLWFGHRLDLMERLVLRFGTCTGLRMLRSCVSSASSFSHFFLSFGRLKLIEDYLFAMYRFATSSMIGSRRLRGTRVEERRRKSSTTSASFSPSFPFLHWY